MDKLVSYLQIWGRSLGCLSFGNMRLSVGIMIEVSLLLNVTDE